MRVYRQRCDSRMTRAQVKAAYVIYRDKGLSLRALGALLWEQFGYASPASCANTLHDLFKREGYKLRDNKALLIERNFKHGHGARKDRAAYKRWRRATIGPFPSDRKSA